MSQRRFTRGPWRAGQVSVRGHKVWAVLNGHRDPVAIVYTTESDANLLAASPKLFGSLKHLIAIVRLHEGELRASAKAKLEQARNLVNELEGN